MAIDATYYKVRINGIVRDCATLIAIGVRRSDRRQAHDPRRQHRPLRSRSPLA